MLKVYLLKAGEVIETEYTDELLDVAWIAKNNDAATFFASVPTLIGTVRLAKVDTYLKGLKRGDSVKLTTGAADGIDLFMVVIEVVCLDRKGVTEISCSGDFISKTNDVWGTLKLGYGAVASTIEDFDLNIVECYDVFHNATMLNVYKKEDLVLGLAYAFDTRRNIGITPFTTYDNLVFKDKLGLGFFKDAKPGVVDAYAPRYMIAAEDIVDYDVSPAQPPVTHIRTTSLGPLGPTPQIPTVGVSIHSTEDVEALATNIRGFYIEGTNISAMWTAQEDSTGVVKSQTLTWSDGVQLTWLGSTRKQIVGIMSDVYIEFANSTTIRFRNRETDAIVKEIITAPTEFDVWTAADIVDYMTTRTIRFENEYPEATYEMLWFKKLTLDEDDSTLVYLGVYGTYNSALETMEYGFVKGDSAPYLAAGYSDYYLTGACYGRELTYELYDALIYTADEVGWNQLSFNVTILEDGLGEPYVSTSADMLPVFAMPASIYGSAVTSQKALDLWAWDSERNKALVLWRAETADGKVWLLEQVTDMMLLSATVRWYERGNAGGFVSSAIRDYVESALLMVVNADEWWIGTVSTPGEAHEVQLTGSVSDWAGTTTMAFRMMKGSILGVLNKGENVWEVFIQMTDVPFLSRVKGDASVMQKIAEGKTNVVDLDFKVGALQQLDANRWDADKGRIEVEMSQFYVWDNNEERANGWDPRLVNDLNVMALGAYVEVYLDARDAVPVLMKVTSFSFTYEGAVVAKVSGIIVE